MAKRLIDFSQSLDNVKDTKIFFGQHDAIQRYDRFKYRISEKLIQAQQAATWFPKEVSFTKDKTNINEIPEEDLEIYRANLLFQTVADSYANRFLDNVLSAYITSPEWEAVIKWQAHFELLHSESYSHNIREVFTDPEKFFNDGFKNPEIRKRLELELDTLENTQMVLENNDSSEIEKKKALLNVILHQYALESVRFFVSFLYTYKINDLNANKLQGSENNITLIANDESIHVAIFKHLINILKTEKSEGFTDIVNSDWFEQRAKEIFISVIKSELDWFEYLSSIKSIPGFVYGNMKDFLDFYANRSLGNVGIEYRDVEANDIVNFFESKKNIKNQKALAQETDQLSYNIGVLTDNDFDNADLEFEIK